MVKRRREEEEEEAVYDEEGDDGDDDDDDDDDDEGGGDDDYEEEEDNNSRIDYSNVPLHERLSKQQTMTVETASSTTGTSARKRLRIERKAASSRDREVASIAGDWDANNNDKKKKKHKNAPAELKSNRPVRRLRDQGNNTAAKHVDPRFSDLHGRLKHQSFFQSFDFLDKYQEDEIGKLGKAMKKAKSPALKEQLKQELGTRKQEMTERRRALKLQERMRSVKSEERAKVAAGKKPYFLKDSAKKALALEERFDELKQQGRGKLKKFIEKKRIKNAKKDVRWIPNSREGGAD